MNRTLLATLLCYTCFSCTVQDQVDQDNSSLDEKLLTALDQASPSGHFFHFILADENRLDLIPNQEPRNPLTHSKVKLGKLLFFETALGQGAKDPRCYETYSCGTCHVPSSGFLPGRIQGIADGAEGFGFQGSIREKLPYYEAHEVDAQGARPLTVMNVAYMTNTLWSGMFGAHDVNVGTEASWHGTLAEINHLGMTGLESQNIEGVKIHRMFTNPHFLDDFGYRELFDKAFPEMDPSERYSDTALSFALSAYLRTILTTRAPFQNYLRGDRSAITENQKKGALLFFGDARCSKCHNAPSLSSMTFHALGTKDLYEMGGINTSAEDRRNLGRAVLTNAQQDEYRFKVPQLYNLKSYKTFFHGSSKQTLEEVIDYKVNAHSENKNVPNTSLSPLFQPLDLTSEEKEQLIDFLRNALYDPDMDRYVPTSLLSGYCLPNNDARSKEALLCN